MDLRQRQLPKHTEYFVSDIHGEYNAFSHILRNGCGAVRRAVEDVLGDRLTEDEIDLFCTLVYYPQEKLPLLLEKVKDPNAWRARTAVHLAQLAHHMAFDRPAECVRAAFGAGDEGPAPAAPAADPAIAEAALALLRDPTSAPQADPDPLIVALALGVQRLSVEHLHMLGDVYDRGSAPDKIVDLLGGFHSIDIEWGNHDVVWMGAALGQRGCIAHVVRNCARYGNLDILTGPYGMDLQPLLDFAVKTYEGDSCEAFQLKVNPGLSGDTLDANVKVQKAMAILQFKVEAQLIDRYPGFDLEKRKLLHLVDYERGVVPVDGVEYEMTDTYFPTVDENDPYRLTPEEEDIMSYLEQAFIGSEKLQRHIRILLDKGSLYRIANGNLLLHACVPLNPDGTLKQVDVFGKVCAGRALYDEMQEWVYKAFRSEDPEERRRGRDLIWYLWLGEGSPLFAKSKMATFEIYLCRDRAARKEVKNPFYQLFDDPAPYRAIFEDFGLDPSTAHLICGHVPVKVKDGEDPVKADGRVICIDGGFSAAYQKTTGIAGFTLVSAPEKLVLYSHEPLPSLDAAIRDDFDIRSEARVLEEYATPRTLADCD